MSQDYEPLIDMPDHYRGYRKLLNSIILTGYQEIDPMKLRAYQTELSFIKFSYADVVGRDPRKKRFAGINFHPDIYLLKDFVPQKTNGGIIYYAPVKIELLVSYGDPVPRK